MSRSHKRNPYVKDKNSKYMKRQGNVKVRKSDLFSLKSNCKIKSLNPNITDTQLEQSLDQIHIAPNDDGSGTATNEQESHYYKWHKEAVQGALQGKYSEPNTKGDYTGEIRGTYCWTGSM